MKKFRSLESHESTSNNLLKSHHDLVVRQKQKLQQQEWVETIDPSKLLLGNVIGPWNSVVVVHKKGFYYKPTVCRELTSDLLEKNRKRVAIEKIDIRFALDIAKWEFYLHSEKIIHRDVKPDNMLMDEKKLIKLADFGESVVEPLYMKSCEVGTLGYMAPSHTRINAMLYAFGDELRPSIPLDCPRWLANLMEQCWHTDPSKRPEMKDVVIELEKIGKAEGLQTQSEDREAVYGCFCVFRH
ncbi:serine/threonine-protein kinase HT1-like protein [Tanacetum coccineum]